MYNNNRILFDYPMYTARNSPYSYGRYQDQMDYMDDWPVFAGEMPRNMQPAGLNEALRIITEAVEGEKEDRDFYETLVNMASSPEDKEIITGIRKNEIKHNEMFRRLYFELTGRKLEPERAMGAAGMPEAEIRSYCEGLKKALMGEQHAVEKYRRILFAMTDRRHINMMTEIITDELRHLGLYNYLYSKNNCSV